MARLRTVTALSLTVIAAAALWASPARAGTPGHARRSGAAWTHGNRPTASRHSAASRANPGVTGANVKMDQDSTGSPHNEVWLTLDPSNAQHILGGANDYRGGPTGTGFYASTDGGSTWHDGLLPMPTGVDSGGDPWARFNRDGSKAFFSQLGFNADPTLGGCDPLSGVFVSTSTTHGVSWSTATRLATNGTLTFNDKPSIGVDLTQGIAGHSGNVYLAYTKFGYPTLTDCENDSSTTSSPIVLRRSTDGGSTWGSEVTVTGSFNDAQGAAIAVGNDGTLYIAFQAYAPCSACIVVAKSTDGGQTFTQSQVATINSVDSLPAGSTQSFRTDSFPTIGVDSNGLVLVAWADKRGGATQSDIWLAKGSHGSGWSAPVRVNQVTNGDQWFPALAVDDANHVYVGYSDRRDDPSNILYNVYVSASVDSGASWADTLASTVQSDPRAVNFGSDLFVGDYQGLDVARDGSFAWASWTDTRNDTQDAYAGRVDYSGGGGGTTPTSLSSAIAPTIGVWGTAFTLTGTLSQGGAGVPDEQIVVQKRPYGSSSWSSVAAVTTSASGGYSAPLGKPDRRTDYRALFQGSTELASSTSPVSTAQVRVGVIFNVGNANLRPGDTAQFAGYVAPAHAGKKVQVQQLTNSGWVTIQTVMLDSASRFRATARLASSGWRLYRAVYATQDANHMWNISKNIRVNWS